MSGLILLGAAVGQSTVTTSMAALGSVWPEHRPGPLLVEADPSGGDLVARLAQLRGDTHLAEEPSLQTLAAAGRLGLSVEVVNQ